MIARHFDRTRWDGLQAALLVLGIALVTALPYALAHAVIVGWLR